MRGLRITVYVEEGEDYGNASLTAESSIHTADFPSLGIQTIANLIRGAEGELDRKIAARKEAEFRNSLKQEKEK